MQLCMHASRLNFDPPRGHSRLPQIGAMPMLSAHDLKAKHVRLLRNFFAAKAALPPGTSDHVLPGRKAGLAPPRKMTPNVQKLWSERARLP